MQWCLEQLLYVVSLFSGVGTSVCERLVLRAQALIAFCVWCWLSRMNWQCFKGLLGETGERFYSAFHWRKSWVSQRSVDFSNNFSVRKKSILTHPLTGSPIQPSIQLTHPTKAHNEVDPHTQPSTQPKLTMKLIFICVNANQQECVISKGSLPAGGEQWIFNYGPGNLWEGRGKSKEKQALDVAFIHVSPSWYGPQGLCRALHYQRILWEHKWNNCKRLSDIKSKHNCICYVFQKGEMWRCN